MKPERKKTKRGRPNLYVYPQKISIIIPLLLLEEIEQEAKRRGISRNQVILERMRK